MSNVIHGNSHQCIKFMRDKPAALSVLWIYASRTNADGVSWPSVRGLAKSTGWSAGVCHEARAFLVEKGALEEVKDYLRPQWKNLTPQELTRVKNIDKSQYFKVTGKFTHKNKTYPLFYHGGDQVSAVDEKIDDATDDSSDVSPERTSDGGAHRTAAHIGPDGTELNTNESKLDSSKSELDTSSSELKNAAAAAEPDKVPVVTSTEIDKAIFTPSKEIPQTPANAENPLSSSAALSPIAESERPNIFKVYEDVFGTIPGAMVDVLKDAAKTWSETWIKDALLETAKGNGKSWKYTERILERWQREGKPQLAIVPKPADTPAPQKPIPANLFRPISKASGGENGNA